MWADSVVLHASDGIWVLPSVKQDLLVTFPFFDSRDLDFAGLKLMRVKVIRSSRPFGTLQTLASLSSIQALIAGCRTLRWYFETLHFF